MIQETVEKEAESEVTAVASNEASELKAEAISELENVIEAQVESAMWKRYAWVVYLLFVVIFIFVGFVLFLLMSNTSDNESLKYIKAEAMVHLGHLKLSFYSAVLKLEQNFDVLVQQFSN